MEKGKEYLTQEKFDELSEELDHLRRVKRREIAENLEYAKSLGDLSENAEYHQAREQQATVEERITTLESILRSAEIVSVHHSDVVEVGSVVVVQKDGTKERKTYQVVSPEESDIAAGKISYRSPLGETMLGKKKKEKFIFNTPSGKMQYTILDIQ